MDFTANFIFKETHLTDDLQGLEVFLVKMHRQGWEVHRGWVGFLPTPYIG